MDTRKHAPLTERATSCKNQWWALLDLAPPSSPDPWAHSELNRRIHRTMRRMFAADRRRTEAFNRGDDERKEAARRWAQLWKKRTFQLIDAKQILDRLNAESARRGEP